MRKLIVDLREGSREVAGASVVYRKSAAARYDERMADGLQNDTSVELTGTFAFSDVLKFQYSQFYRRTWWIVVLITLVPLVGIVLALLVVVLTHNFQLALRNGTPFLLLLLFWIVLMTTPYRVAKKQWSTTRALSGPTTFTFSPRGMHQTGLLFSSDISYEALWAVRETKSLLLIYTSARSALVLPKRFFKDAAQQNEWRILIEERISPKRITRSGFLGRWL
jgi:hypothetical protein